MHERCTRRPREGREKALRRHEHAPAEDGLALTTGRTHVNLCLETDDLVWYAAYASNMNSERFACYLAGGRPRGAQRTYEGCRDQSPPHHDLGVHLDGGLVFAGTSTVWGGGVAFYNPDVAGRLAARAYLITFGQFSDVVAQELRRPVGSPLPVDGRTGRRWSMRSHVYETVLNVGERAGLPMLTITSLQTLKPAPPSAAYLRTMMGGLTETFDWGPDAQARYLMKAKGIEPTWTAERLAELCEFRTCSGAGRASPGAGSDDSA
jgi:hypothetical protein